jgi:hypothetical protein
MPFIKCDRAAFLYYFFIFSPQSYRFSNEEMRVLRQCNRDSFYQRCLPLATMLGVGTYFGVKSGGFIQMIFIVFHLFGKHSCQNTGKNLLKRNLYHMSITLWDGAPYGMVNWCMFAELHIVTFQKPMVLSNELLHATQVLNNLHFASRVYLCR